MGTYLIKFPLANTVDPDQTAFIRAASSGSFFFLLLLARSYLSITPGSALFAKVLKGVFMG